MHKWFIHALIAIAFTLCAVSYAIAQDTPPPPPEPEAAGFQLKSTLSGAQEVTPPMNSTLTGGEIMIDLDAGLSEAQVTLMLEGDAAAVTGLHLHCQRPGANGPAFVGLVNPGMCDAAQLATGMLTCTITNADFVPDADCMGEVGRPINNIASLFFAARDGLVYLNVHTMTNGGGELRGQLMEADDADASDMMQ